MHGPTPANNSGFGIFSLCTRKNKLAICIGNCLVISTIAGQFCLIDWNLPDITKERHLQCSTKYTKYNYQITNIPTE